MGLQVQKKFRDETAAAEPARSLQDMAVLRKQPAQAGMALPCSASKPLLTLQPLQQRRKPLQVCCAEVGKNAADGGARRWG